MVDNREIWERLIRTVMEDSVLSEDEHILLKSVLSDLETYEETLSRALADNIIDTTEKVNLFNQRIKLIKKMYEVANEDDNITEEETELIKTISKIINDLAETEDSANKAF